MTILAQIIVGIVLGLVAYWVKAKDAAPASVVQPRRDALRDRLRKRVRDAGWTIAFVATSAILSGCYTPAIYIPAGEPVRIARPIRNAQVDVILPSGLTARRTFTIPAGWYALPDPDEAPSPVPAVHGEKEQP